MRITLLGEPGAGKTTLGQSLEAEGLAIYISGSALLERYIEAKKTDWKDLRDNKRAGKRASARLTHELLKEELTGLAPETVVLLDGFPKTREEIDQTEEALQEGTIDLAIYLECRIAERLRRVRERLKCERCGRVTNRAFRPPAEHGGCGGAYAPRDDDHPEAHEVRKDEDFTEPLVEHFDQTARLKRIPEGSPEEVLSAVIELIRTSPK